MNLPKEYKMNVKMDIRSLPQKDAEALIGKALYKTIMENPDVVATFEITKVRKKKSKK